MTTTLPPVRVGMPSTYEGLTSDQLHLYKQWEEWCELSRNFLGLRPVAMTNEQSEFFLSSSYLENTAYEEGELTPLPVLDPSLSFRLRVYEQHAQRLKLNTSVSCKLFISILLAYSLGELVMYLHVLKFLQLKYNYSLTRMQELAYGFPNGFHAPEDLELLWLRQKTDERNMLDSVSF
jgi:hypothetical protein